MDLFKLGLWQLLPNRLVLIYQTYFITFSSFTVPRACTLLDMRAEPFLLLAKFGSQCGAKVLSLEYLPNFDLSLPVRHGVGTAFDPFDRLL